MKILKSFFRVLNIQMVLIAVLAVGSTYISRTMNFTGEFPLTLIGTAIIFPLVFSINGAYKRREKVLDQYAILKGHGRAIYYAARDWLESNDKEQLQCLECMLQELLEEMREMFHSRKEEQEKSEQDVYHKFSELSKFIQSLRDQGLASGEASRLNQFLSKMIIGFENMKHIHQYRTPRTLRTYNRVFIYILPIVYGPHFAHISKDFPDGLWLWIPILLSAILVGLDNVQDDLENPFDQVGEDDVMINADKFAAQLEF